MDLFAYSQIDNLEHFLTDNNIQIPRLRGLRLMSEEKPYSKKDIKNICDEYALYDAEQLCCCGFDSNANWSEYSSKTKKLRRKHLIYESKDAFTADAINWSKWHGRKRKVLKYKIKNVRKKVLAQYTLFNKYCGVADILYVHTRLGGGNWDYYEGNTTIANQPWFIEKIDDAFDNTYCDIYVKIK